MNKRLFLLFSFFAMSGALLAASMDLLSGSGKQSVTGETPAHMQALKTSAATDKAQAKESSRFSLIGQNAARILGELHPSKDTVTTVEARHLYQLERPGFAGNFLASHFAQSEYNWNAASDYLEKVIATDEANGDLMRRSMILAMGAGDLETASARAKQLLTVDKTNSLAYLIQTVSAMQKGDNKEALSYIEHMNDGDISNFIRPMLAGWAKTGKARYADKDLLATTIHMYNAALMAIYEGKEDKATDFAREIVGLGRISPNDAERSADIFAFAGANKEAEMLYEGALSQDPGNPDLQKKLAALKAGSDQIQPLLSHLKVETPLHGAAVALYDMARILYQEQSDSSAKLFAQMALALNPEHLDSHMLLANTMARNGRYDEAIDYFSSIKSDHPSYLVTKRHVADLMLEADRKDEALALLNHLFMDFNDVDALIKIGDIHRNSESYDDALIAYNRAAEHIGDEIPEKYWHLLYARGMAYEREGNWQQAESDLKAAIAFRPDHPYLLNYLGYGWADQGLNLDESLSLIERAASLRPTDAYIRDSLGWVLYKLSRYKDAIPHLEKAVELMPYDPTLNDHLGDAYWQIGRRLEARFQWERAMNNSEDPGLKTVVQQKLYSGLDAKETVREAKSDIKAPVSAATAQ